MNSTSIDLRDYIESLSTFGLVQAVNLFVGETPDGPPVPDQVVALYDTPGLPPLSGYEYERPTAQIRIRGNKGAYEETYALIEAIVVALHDLVAEINGTRYIQVRAMGSVNFLSWDTLHRPLFSANVLAYRATAVATAEQYAYFILQDTDVSPNLEARLSGFDVIIVNPAIGGALVAEVASRLPGAILLAYICAQETPAFHPANAGFPYVQDMEAVFPPECIWKNLDTDEYVSLYPDSYHYTLLPAAIQFWRDWVTDVLRPMGFQGIYIDNYNQVASAGTEAFYETLGPIDNDGDDVADTPAQLVADYETLNPLLSAALRGDWPDAILFGNVGTYRVDANLNGIGLESGYSAAVYSNAAEVAQSPKINIAFIDTQEKLDQFRALRASDPELADVLLGQFNNTIEIVEGSNP